MAMMNVVRSYTRMLEKHPLRTHIMQMGVIFGTGDVIAQTYLEKRGFLKMDGWRTVRFAAIGALYVAPVTRMWYGYLDKTFGAWVPKTAVKKIAMDQLVFAPFFIASVIAAIEHARNGQNWDRTKDYVRYVWKEVVVANWMIFPAVHFANHYGMPLEYRGLVGMAAALVFNTYLAWKTNVHNEAHPKAPHERQRLTLDDFERSL